MKRVILLEDDAVLSKEIATFLSLNGFECDRESDGEKFLQRITEDKYDVYLLDVNLPGMSGFEVCKNIRTRNKNTPIIMLTAYGEIQDKKEAYELGADDYLVKPFHLEELHLRLVSILKRGTILQADEEIVIDDLKIKVGDKLVYRGGELIELTPKEYNLLLFLARSPGTVFSKQSIAENVWNIYFETSYNTIEVYINFLRKKIDKNFEKKLIQTKTGYGYYLAK